MSAIFTKLRASTVDMVPQEHRTLFTGAAIVLGVLPILSYSITSYRAWLALGPGGIPSNFAGWMVQSMLHLVARTDLRVPAPYKLEKVEAIYGPAGLKSYFEDGEFPKARSGSRPQVPNFIVPQRQTSEQGTEEMRLKMNAFLDALANNNPKLIQSWPSVLEGPTSNGLGLATDLQVPAHMKGTKGEFVHVHLESSSHMALSPKDSQMVIESGWGERHPVSGVLMPWGYTMVYSPRNETELAAWKSLVVAAARFVTSGATEKIVSPTL